MSAQPTVRLERDHDRRLGWHEWLLVESAVIDLVDQALAAQAVVSLDEARRRRKRGRR